MGAFRQFSTDVRHQRCRASFQSRHIIVGALLSLLSFRAVYLFYHDTESHCRGSSADISTLSHDLSDPFRGDYHPVDYALAELLQVGRRMVTNFFSVCSDGVFVNPLTWNRIYSICATEENQIVLWCRNGAVIEARRLLFGNDGIGIGVNYFIKIWLYDFQWCLSFLNVVLIACSLSDFWPAFTASANEAFVVFNSGDGTGMRVARCSVAWHC